MRGPKQLRNAGSLFSVSRLDFAFECKDNPERPNLVKCGRMFENSLSGKGYSVSRFRFISVGSTDRKLLSVALIVGQIRPDKEPRHPNGTNFFLV